jgi:hypothetical protein
MVKHLPSKCEALNSNPNTTTKKKKITEFAHVRKPIDAMYFRKHTQSPGSLNTTEIIQESNPMNVTKPFVGT